MGLIADMVPSRESARRQCGRSEAHDGDGRAPPAWPRRIGCPNGPHGTLRDLIFYLCNNHVSLAAISPTFADEVPMICSCPDHDLPLASGTPLRHRLCPRGPPVLGTAAPPCTAQLSGIRFLFACLVAIGTTSCAREPAGGTCTVSTGAPSSLATPPSATRAAMVTAAMRTCSRPRCHSPSLPCSSCCVIGRPRCAC